MSGSDIVKHKFIFIQSYSIKSEQSAVDTKLKSRINLLNIIFILHRFHRIFFLSLSFSPSLSLSLSLSSLKSHTKQKLNNREQKPKKKRNKGSSDAWEMFKRRSWSLTREKKRHNKGQISFSFFFILSILLPRWLAFF